MSTNKNIESEAEVSESNGRLEMKVFRCDQKQEVTARWRVAADRSKDEQQRPDEPGH